MYTALSSVKTYDNLYCIGDFKKSAIKVNKDGLLEYERLKQNDLFSSGKRNVLSGNTVTVLVHNVRSLPRHVHDILNELLIEYILMYIYIYIYYIYIYINILIEL